MIRVTAPFCVVLLMTSFALAYDPGNDEANTAKFEPRTHTSDAGGTLSYRFFKPADLAKDGKYPLLVFLHGAGERGTDNAAQLKWGGKFVGQGIQGKQKCFVIAPQCPPGKQWVNTPWAQG